MMHNNPLYSGCKNWSVCANLTLFLRYITEGKRPRREHYVQNGPLHVQHTNAWNSLPRYREALCDFFSSGMNFKTLFLTKVFVVGGGSFFVCLFLRGRGLS